MPFDGTAVRSGKVRSLLSQRTYYPLAQLRLDINDLLRKRIFVPGSREVGRLTWTNTATREDVTSIGFEADFLDPDDAWARLTYSANGALQHYRILISHSPCHYGGVRWWWKCPRSGRRVAKLYLPAGRFDFRGAGLLSVGVPQPEDNCP